jgi:hypothetical protein
MYSLSSSTIDILTVLSPDFIFSWALYEVTYLEKMERNVNNHHRRETATPKHHFPILIPLSGVGTTCTTAIPLSRRRRLPWFTRSASRTTVGRNAEVFSG